MRKNKIKEILVVLSIIGVLIIFLLVFGFISSEKDQSKTPEFEKFVLTTNFPINDYIYKEEAKPTDLSKIFEDKKEQENTEEENQINQEENISQKVDQLRNKLVKNSESYKKEIFKSNEEIIKEEKEKNRKQLLSKLMNNLPNLKVEKNSFEKIKAKELDFGDSSFSNLKNKNSVTNETKLYRTITADKRIPVILTSSINSALSS